MNAPTDIAAATKADNSVVRIERRPVSLRGFAMREDGSAVEILLLDLSYDGCGVECPERLGVGEKLKLSVLQRGGIEAEVRWYRDGRAGLVFPSGAKPEKQPLPRRHKRVSLNAEVMLRRIGKINYRVIVRDMSPDGCKVELVERPRPEEHLFIKFEGLEPLDGEICWIDNFCAGVRFVHPIHPAVYDLLLARLRV